MGTPDYAVPALRVLAASGLPLVVVTQPDRPAGRGRRLRPSPVRIAAQALGLSVLTPSRLGPKTFETLRALSPRLIITAAYGGILSARYLALPVCGAYNLHASLLPRWRGPNPIAWAIRAEELQTGVTLMAMDRGVDTGPVVDQRVIEIAPSDTTGSLTERLAERAALLLADWLPRLLAGDVPTTPQPSGATSAPKFAAEDARIPWLEGATTVSARIRSLLPEPGPWTVADGERIVIAEAVPAREVAGERPLSAGEIERRGEAWRIGCGTGSLMVLRIKPAGRRAMTPGAYVRGLRREVTQVQ